MAKLLLHFYYDDYYKEVDLSTTSANRITIGSDETNDIVLRSTSVERCAMILIKSINHWYIEDPNRTSIIYNGRNIAKRELEVGQKYQLVTSNSKSNQSFLYVKDANDFPKIYEAYDLTGVNKVLVGHSEKNQIQYKSDKVDEYVLSIQHEENKGYIRDLFSKKYKGENLNISVYINGRRIYSEYELRDQDVIFFSGYEIIYRNTEVKKTIDGYDIVRAVQFIEISTKGDDISIGELKPYIQEQSDDQNRIFYEIQSRLFQPIGEEKVVIPAPRSAQNKPQINWISILLPPVLMGAVYMLIMPLIRSGASGYGSMMLLFSGVAVITSIVNYVTQIKKFKTDKKTRIVDYEKLLDQKRIVLNELSQKEREALYRIHTEYSEALKAVKKRERRLWERSHIHDDFLSTKIGIGDHPLSAKIEAPSINESDSEPDSLIIQAIGLKNQFVLLENVPISVNLKESNVVSILGYRKQVHNLIRSMIYQIALNHSYEEVKLVFLFSKEELELWNWVRWLPHVWDSSKQHRFIAYTKDDARLLLTNINDMIKEREVDDQSSKMKVKNLPHYIFIIADRDIIHNSPIVSHLIAPQENMGITSIFALSDTEWVPQHCKCEIKVDHLKGEMILNGMKSSVQTFDMEDVTLDDVDYFARVMAPIRIKHMASSIGISSHVSLFDVLDIGKIDDLNIESNWKHNRAYESMKTPIGMKMGNEIFYFDIHEKEHGPHGLIAGTTGSGKSETMLAYLVSLCANYHPHQVGFVIVDYKGGGMINDISELPHLLGSITNLDDNDIQRALLSLKSELKHRQRLFDQFKINHIDDYQRLYSEKIAKVALPHLILVVDEFAELKADQPEFMKELVSAARIGRSLGLHLILATQKPAGVVDDQIWSNSKFKICLKVSTPADSNEVLKRTDASYITLPGRAYIQVGNDELFELFQSAYGGVPVKDITESTIEEPSVYQVDLTGRKKLIYPITFGFTESKNEQTQLAVLVKRINETREKLDIPKLDGPWKPALKEVYYLPEYDDNNMFEVSNGDYRVYIGVYDNPSEQAQGVLHLDIAKTGSVIIYGNAAMGKTTMLEACIMYEVTHYTPDELQIYIVDFGSRILSIFKDAPHVGGVILSEELDRFERLMTYIHQTLNNRKNEFTKMGVTSIKAYNRISEKVLPAMHIYIDNVGYLKELEDNQYDTRLATFIREGVNYGIYFILTANDRTVVPYKIVSTITTVVSLNQNEKSDYTAVFGGSVNVIPKKIPGRGIIRYEDNIVEFQGFLPEAGIHEHDITQNIRSTISRINEEYSKQKRLSDVFIIPSLPEIMPLAEVLKKQAESIITDNLVLEIGLDTSELNTVHMQLSDFGGFFITGLRKSGISNAIKVIIQSVLTRYSDQVNIIIIDNFTQELARFDDSTMYINEMKPSENQLSEIQALVEESDKRTIIVVNDFAYFYKVASDNLKDLVADVINMAVYNHNNVIITMKEGGISGYDDISKAVKGIDVGMVFGHSEEGLNRFGIKLSYEKKKEVLRPGQGYFEDVSETHKFQMYYADEL